MIEDNVASLTDGVGANDSLYGYDLGGEGGGGLVGLERDGRLVVVRVGLKEILTALGGSLAESGIEVIQIGCVSGGSVGEPRVSGHFKTGHSLRSLHGEAIGARKDGNKNSGRVEHPATISKLLRRKL